MGTGISPGSPLYILGNLCWECWGPGKTWDGFDTPKFVTVTIAGMYRSPYRPADYMEPPPNGTSFVIEQRPTNPCGWHAEIGIWDVWWWTNVTRLYWIRGPGDRVSYYQAIPADCTIAGFNVFGTIGYMENYMYGGTHAIT